MPVNDRIVGIRAAHARRSFGTLVIPWSNEHRDIGKAVAVYDMRYDIFTTGQLLAVGQHSTKALWQIFALPLGLQVMAHVARWLGQPAEILSAV